MIGTEKTELATSFRSVADMWHHRVESTPETTAMLFRRDGAWVPLTWGEAAARTRRIANGFLAFGLQPEERVILLSATRVEWILCDIAVLCAGGATTTIYPSTTADECAFIVADCEAGIVVVDTVDQLRKLESQALPGVRLIVVIDGDIPAVDRADARVISLEQLEQDGRRFDDQHPQAYDAARRAIGPDRLATLIYTSGTTGRPKGAMLTHDAWIYEGEAIDALGILSPVDKQLLFLPLAHVFAKVLQVTFIRLGIPTVIDGDMDALVKNLEETQPTFFATVPRILEKARERILDRAHASAATARVFEWALAIGRQMSVARQAGREPGRWLRSQHLLADRLVFRDIKRRFGGKLRFIISGGAPLSREVAEFFHALDILVLEGYGLTESSAATTVNLPGSYVFGSVGKPFPGTRIRIADDGEVLIAGRGVMKGYANLPDETREAIDEDGWLHTGDVGLIVEKGHLAITDRKKELIVTAGGKHVAPAALQAKIKDACPFVREVLVHGDKRPYCVALVTLEPARIRAWAREKGLPALELPELLRRPEVESLVWEHIERVNKDLASYETIKAVAVIPDEFTVDDGMLTPTLKLRRRAVEARYAEQIDALYRRARRAHTAGAR